MKNSLDRAKSEPPSPLRILCCAGEASGDLHAAELVSAMRQLSSGIEVFGIGGAQSRRAGVETLVDMAEVNTMGLTEVFSKGLGIVNAYRRVRQAIVNERPALLVLIDFPEFNLALAGVAHRYGVPVFYYVSPQVWAWRRGRVRKILKRVDRLAAIFPFEPEVYGNSAKVTYVGHPLIDRVCVTVSRDETCTRYRFDPTKKLVVLLPGSRAHEIDRLLPEMVGAANLLRQRMDVQFVCALAPTGSREKIEEILSKSVEPIPVVEEDTYNLIHASDLALAASGTVTLETALLERPMILMYQTSWLTYAAARLLVQVPAIGIPNLIAGRCIVPELLQDEVSSERIADEAAAILSDPKRAETMKRDLGQVRAVLGPSGAAKRAAQLALELVG